MKLIILIAAALLLSACAAYSAEGQLVEYASDTIECPKEGLQHAPVAVDKKTRVVKGCNKEETFTWTRKGWLRPACDLRLRADERERV